MLPSVPTPTQTPVPQHVRCVIYSHNASNGLSTPQKPTKSWPILPAFLTMQITFRLVVSVLVLAEAASMQSTFAVKDNVTRTDNFYLVQPVSCLGAVLYIMCVPVLWVQRGNVQSEVQWEGKEFVCRSPILRDQPIPEYLHPAWRLSIWSRFNENWWPQFSFTGVHKDLSDSLETKSSSEEERTGKYCCHRSEYRLHQCIDLHTRQGSLLVWLVDQNCKLPAHRDARFARTSISKEIM
jgi:hypothetical protein